MIITYTAVLSPKYSNPQKTAIDCWVSFPHIGQEPVLFTASKNGPEAHERKIFEDCEKGLYGSIAPYAREVGAALLKIEDVRNRRLSDGYVDAVTGKTWQCNDSSIGKWTAMAASAGMAVITQQNPEPEFQLIAADNTLITLTASDVFALFNQRVMPWVAATMIHARQLKDQAIAGTAPDDLEQGWP